MILKFPKLSLKINLNSSETAKKLDVLKEIISKNNTWGYDIYFETSNLGIKVRQKSKGFNCIWRGNLFVRRFNY